MMVKRAAVPTPPPFSFLLLLEVIRLFHPHPGGAVTGISLGAVPTGICTKGYFQCVNDTICVPQSSNCDKKMDCPNGSDEEDCDDLHDDYYWDSLVKKRPAARSDDLDPECQLSYNGTTCVCRHRQILCGLRRLSHIPEDLPRDTIDLLDFEGNDFRILSPEVLKPLPPNIEELNFAHCNVKEIQGRAFYHLPSLKNLHLDNNDLRTFPGDIFPPDNELQILSLMHNHISSISVKGFVELTELTELDLRGNKITEIRREVLQPLTNLTTLYLQNNQIRYVDSNSFPSLPLDQLSLMENKIESIGKGAFARLPTLGKLFLSNNRLVHLVNGTFTNLQELGVLTLEYNLIVTIEVGVFVDTPKLHSLRLKGNQFRTLDKKVLEPLHDLEYIYFDRFEMCAAASQVRVCEPKGDGISSFRHLLDNPVLRTSVWIMGIVGCAGNLIVLLGRFLAPSNNVVHSFYLRNLAMSDLLMAVYLFAIAFADHRYRGVYLRYEYTWRHSIMCNLCGFLSTLSCQSSAFILTLVTWDRFISVTQPLARKQPSPKTAALTLLALWMLAAAVALAPLTKGYFGEEFYGSNGVCLPLHIHEPYAMGWEYSAVMFVLVNTLALIFICYAYLRMIHEIKESAVACRSTRQNEDRDKVAHRFGVIVLTDCLCWVPIIVVKLVALAGLSIPADLYAWLAILILPINSALNPVLYTLTTTLFRKQMRKVVHSCVHKRKRPPTENNHHSAASDSGFSLSFGFFPLGGARRILSYRNTQSSTTASSKHSWKRKPTAV